MDPPCSRTRSSAPVGEEVRATILSKICGESSYWLIILELQAEDGNQRQLIDTTQREEVQIEEVQPVVRVDGSDLRRDRGSAADANRAFERDIQAMVRRQPARVRPPVEHALHSGIFAHVYERIQQHESVETDRLVIRQSASKLPSRAQLKAQAINSGHHTDLVRSIVRRGVSGFLLAKLQLQCRYFGEVCHL